MNTVFGPSYGVEYNGAATLAGNEQAWEQGSLAGWKVYLFSAGQPGWQKVASPNAVDFPANPGKDLTFS